MYTGIFVVYNLSWGVCLGKGWSFKVRAKVVPVRWGIGLWIGGWEGFKDGMRAEGYSTRQFNCGVSL